MSEAETETRKLHFKEISRFRNPDTDYVTIFFDVFDGPADDLSTTIVRWLVIFTVETAPEKLEIRNYRSYGDPDPTYVKLEDAQRKAALVFENFKTIKEPDRDAANFARQQETMLDMERYQGYGTYGTSRQKKRSEMYAAFLTAIATVKEHPEDDAAWNAIDEWRMMLALEGEK